MSAPIEFTEVILCAVDRDCDGPITYFNRVSVPDCLLVDEEATIKVAHSMIGETYFEASEMFLADPAKVPHGIGWRRFDSKYGAGVGFEFASLPGNLSNQII